MLVLTNLQAHRTSKFVLRSLDLVRLARVWDLLMWLKLFLQGTRESARDQEPSHPGLGKSPQHIHDRNCERLCGSVVPSFQPHTMARHRMYTCPLVGIFRSSANSSQRRRPEAAFRKTNPDSQSFDPSHATNPDGNINQSKTNT